MRIVGVVEVSYWNVPTGSRGPKQRSTLVIGKQPTTKELFLLVQNANNPEGVKYKIVGNIVQMFTRFLPEGKATVRFLNPPHDLSIKCEDKVLMLSFMRVLKKGTDRTFEIPDSWLSSLYNPKPVPKKTPTSLVLSSSSGLSKSLPRSLTSLTATDLGVSRLDPIRKLLNLEVLDVGQNLLESVPAELGMLRLKSLNLSGNLLGEKHNWEFLYGKPLVKTLHTLNLSRNNLASLPLQLGNCTQLMNLNISENNLEELPSNIGLLRNLRVLNVSENNISVCPGTIQELKLDCINISDIGPSKEDFVENDVVNMSDGNAPSLAALAAVSIIKNRVAYHGILPRSLDNYLQTLHFCRCGTPTYGGYFQHVRINVDTLCATLIKSTAWCCHEGDMLVCLNTFCSLKCVRSYQKLFQVEKRSRQRLLDEAIRQQMVDAFDLPLFVNEVCCGCSDSE